MDKKFPAQVIRVEYDHTKKHLYEACGMALDLAQACNHILGDEANRLFEKWCGEEFKQSEVVESLEKLFVGVHPRILALFFWSVITNAAEQQHDMEAHYMNALARLGFERITLKGGVDPAQELQRIIDTVTKEEKDNTEPTKH